MMSHERKKRRITPKISCISCCVKQQNSFFRSNNAVAVCIIVSANVYAHVQMVLLLTLNWTKNKNRKLWRQTSLCLKHVVHINNESFFVGLIWLLLLLPLPLFSPLFAINNTQWRARCAFYRGILHLLWLLGVHAPCVLLFIDVLVHIASTYCWYC